MGLRDTLEPDPDNTGVGSFPILAAFFFDSSREFSCFKQKSRGIHVSIHCLTADPRSFAPQPGRAAQRACASSRARRRHAPRAELATPAPKIPRVTTTVVVQGKTEEYLPDAVTVGTLDGAPLPETPLSATVVTRELLNDQGARLLSDVVKNDASIGEDYAPVGYYGDYEIRGFPIDLATGLQINGMTIAGEQDVPLENKERVEFLKGIAGVESGVASAGGLIDYVTKRPAAIQAADLATDHRGSQLRRGRSRPSLRQPQAGGRARESGRREIMSYVNDANGWRAMGAGAADWKITPAAILKGDFEYQHKVERSVCGYQLLGGRRADLHAKASGQRASLSIDDAGRAVLGQAEYLRHIQHRRAPGLRSAARLEAFAAASYSHSLIDDNVVYAYGMLITAVMRMRWTLLLLLRSRRHVRYLRLSQPRRTAHRCAGRGDWSPAIVKTGAVTHDLAVADRTLPPQRAAAGFHLCNPSHRLHHQDGAVYADRL